MSGLLWCFIDLSFLVSYLALFAEERREKRAPASRSRQAGPARNARRRYDPGQPAFERTPYLAQRGKEKGRGNT